MKKIIKINESERESILNLHNTYKNRLMEQTAAPATAAPATATPATATPATATPATATQGRKGDCSTTKNPSRCKQKVLDIQVKINDKCTKISKKLVEDGIYGPNTMNAINACTGIDLNKSSGTQTPGGVQTPAGTQTPGGVQTPSGATVASTTDEPVDSLTV